MKQNQFYVKILILTCSYLKYESSFDNYPFS